MLMAAVGVQAQTIITVHGTVVSATDSEPLIGASVISNVKGSTGAATDLDGNFTISVPEGSELTISYVGFKSQTVKAAPQLTVMLVECQE